MSWAYAARSAAPDRIEERSLGGRVDAPASQLLKANRQARTERLGFIEE
jgi:hypothetical protein